MTPEGCLLLWEVNRTVSCSCGLMQVDVYINRHTMKYWNCICAVLLLTLASRGEILSSIFVVHQVWIIDQIRICLRYKEMMVISTPWVISCGLETNTINPWLWQYTVLKTSLYRGLWTNIEQNKCVRVTQSVYSRWFIRSHHYGVFYFPSFQTNIKYIDIGPFLYNKNLVIADNDA